MKTSSPSPPTLRFGVFELDPRAGELRKKGMKIRLQGQPVDILAMLFLLQFFPGDDLARAGVAPAELQRLFTAHYFNNYKPRQEGPAARDAFSWDMVTTKTWTDHGQFVSNGNGGVERALPGHQPAEPAGRGGPANDKPVERFGDKSHDYKGSAWSVGVSSRIGLFFWGPVWDHGRFRGAPAGVGGDVAKESRTAMRIFW